MRFIVWVPVEGFAGYEVDAETEEEAKQKALVEPEYKARVRWSHKSVEANVRRARGAPPTEDERMMLEELEWIATLSGSVTINADTARLALRYIASLEAEREVKV